jgi:hypothetical protein
MANARRGEIEACLNGKTWKLCLTLGALAELEQAFGDDDMLALAQRFEKGRLSATEAVRILGAGLRGAGHDVSDEEVKAMRTENGIVGIVDIVARLLAATFGMPGGAAEESTPRSEVRSLDPFRGTT